MREVDATETDERDWLSVRMRASVRGAHVSGAERLVPRRYATAVVNAFLDRARYESTVEPDRITLTVDPVDSTSIWRIPVLPVRTVGVGDFREGRSRARELLAQWGVGTGAIKEALRLLTCGANPDGGNMRGAALLDRHTGSRLDADRRRGVRVSFVDMDLVARAWFDGRFRKGFPTPRFRDALILASKVARLQSVTAEICWSDDPEFLPGYVASPQGGYVRFTCLKERGSPLGGRMYFVDPERLDLERDMAYLESQPVLVTIRDAALLKEA